MNRSIGKWIRIGLFAALSSGGVALAQSSQQNDTGASGTVGTPPIVSPTDRDNMQNKTDLDEDIKTAPTDRADDIHRTGGMDENKPIDQKNNIDEQTEQKTTTTTKKKHKRIQGRTGNQPSNKSNIKSNPDVNRDNDVDMRDKSNVRDKSDIDDLTK